jgi:hypothetical protein
MGLSMFFKLPKDSLAVLKKNGVTEEAFLAWLTAKYKFTYHVTLWTSMVFLEIVFTSICWSYYQKKPEVSNVLLGFWFILNMAIIVPIGLKARPGSHKNNRTMALIQNMMTIYCLHYADPKKMTRFPPRAWEKIRSFLPVTN